MRPGINLGCNYKLNSTHGLCKEVILYRSGFCNKVVIKYALVSLEPNYYVVFFTEVVFRRWSLIKGFTII